MRQLLILLALLAPLHAWAAIDTFEFKDEATRKRFSTLTDELRCPKCQNQNLADSNSPIAKDLRTEVYRMLQQDRPNDEIVDFMVARYGEFVLYKPRVQQSTYILWYGPFVLLAFGALVIYLLSRKKQKSVKSEGENLPSVSPSDNAEKALSPEQQRTLDNLLKQGDEK